MPLDPGEQFMSAPDPNQKTDPNLKEFFQGLGQAVFGWGKGNPQPSQSGAPAAAPTQNSPASPTQNASAPITPSGNPPAGAPLSPTGPTSALDMKLPDSNFNAPIALDPTSPGDAMMDGNKDGSFGGGLGKALGKLFMLGK